MCLRSRLLRVCQLVHGLAARVYLDGANLNAQMGFAQPGVRRRRFAPEPAQDLLHFLTVVAAPVLARWLFVEHFGEVPAR